MILVLILALPPLQVTDTISQLQNQLIKLYVTLVARRILLPLVVILLRLLHNDSLPCHLLDNRVALLLDKLVDYLAEVVAAQRALSLHLKPLFCTFLVEVVLFIAGKNDDLVVLRHEIDQTDRAVGQILVLLGVLCQTVHFKTVDVALEG